MQKNKLIFPLSYTAFSNVQNYLIFQKFQQAKFFVKTKNFRKPFFNFSHNFLQRKKFEKLETKAKNELLNRKNDTITATDLFLMYLFFLFTTKITNGGKDTFL